MKVERMYFGVHVLISLVALKRKSSNTVSIFTKLPFNHCIMRKSETEHSMAIFLCTRIDQHSRTSINMCLYPSLLQLMKKVPSLPQGLVCQRGNACTGARTSQTGGG